MQAHVEPLLLERFRPISGSYPLLEDLLKYVEQAANNTAYLTLMAGLCFLSWPYVQTSSKLQGFNSGAAFGIVQGGILLVFCIPLLATKWQQVAAPCFLAAAILFYCNWQWGQAPYWKMVYVAGTISAIGLIHFLQLLEITKGQSRAVFYGTVIGIQVIGALGIDYLLGASVTNRQFFGNLIIALGIFVGFKMK